jgi:uncharacterized membrane protein
MEGPVDRSSTEQPSSGRGVPGQDQGSPVPGGEGVSRGPRLKHRRRPWWRASKLADETLGLADDTLGLNEPGVGEPFWPAQLAVLVAIGLSATLPGKLTVGPTWLLPAFEGVLLAGLAITTPMRVHPEHPRRRRVAILMIALVNATNLISLALLVHYLLRGGRTNGRELITAGALIWLTNVIVFALWYWESDRGGPAERAARTGAPPDFLFPQMTNERLGRDTWLPKFLDYLYVSLTNATAFSPTDTMPLSALAKSLMGIQALISLVTIGLVVARAVNILQ